MLLRLPSALATPPKSKPNVKEKKSHQPKERKQKQDKTKEEEEKQQQQQEQLAMGLVGSRGLPLCPFIFTSKCLLASDRLPGVIGLV